MNVPLEEPNEQRFLRTHRRALLGLAIAWHTVLFVRLVRPDEVHVFVGAAVVLYAWGLAPYLALTGLAARIGHRLLLLTASGLLLGGDVLSGISVLSPGSSTDAIALVTYPILATFGLIPITWLVGWLLNR